jgi:hypothetical protein
MVWFTVTYAGNFCNLRIKTEKMNFVIFDVTIVNRRNKCYDKF